MSLRLQGCTLTLVLLLSACGGGDGSGTDAPADDTGATPPANPTPPPAPAPPAPPSPQPPPAAPLPPDTDPPVTPSPSPGAAAPSADAGADRRTVEEQDVIIDGSRTRDADGDPIVFDWELVSAPPGSAIGVNADTSKFFFRPDVPGVYVLRLTASDGDRSTRDTVRVTAEALLAAEGGGKMAIDAASAAGSDRRNLEITTSALYDGRPVGLTVASDAAWLDPSPAATTIAAAGGKSSVALLLDPAELGRLENGMHTARVTLTPAGGFEPAAVEVTLELTLPVVRNVVPHVAYTGRPQRVTLFGDGLSKADGRSLFVGGVEAAGVSASSDTRAVVDLPAIVAGTHTVRFGHDLGIAREMSRLVVRDSPAYQDADVFSPILAIAVEYDAERDAFYVSADGEPAQRLFRSVDTWQFQPVAGTAGPVRVGADGQRLYAVAAGNCTINELEPLTLAVLASNSKGECDVGQGERVRDIWALADGRVLLHHQSEMEFATEYPGFDSTGIFPARHAVLSHLTYERNRVFWSAGDVSTYDVQDEASRMLDIAGIDPIATDADGSRFLDGRTLRDQNGNRLGTLAGEGQLFPALDSTGARAISVDPVANAIVVHDTSGPGPIFPLTGSIPLPAPVDFARVFIHPTDTTAFVFARIIDPSGSRPHRVFIRNVPR